MSSQSSMPSQFSAVKFVPVLLGSLLFLVISQGVLTFLALHSLCHDDRDFSSAMDADAPASDTDTHGGAITSGEQQSKKGRIAIISGFVSRAFEERKSDPSVKVPRINETLMDHMLNKQCYARLWDYDYIYNTTWGFPFYEDVTSRHDYWVEYGTWHRVPHMLAALDQGYDWVMYADTDYVFQDMTTPLESFLRELELHGKKSVSVITPIDGPGHYTFSAFAIMIKNDRFGRRVLENWMEFSRGLCPNGNFQESIRGKYQWIDSDQPGAWYALAKTHDQFFREKRGVKYELECNKTTGFLNTNRFLGPEMNAYFKFGVKSKLGTHADDLIGMEDDQPIVWSRIVNGSKSGIGVQQTFGKYVNANDKKGEIPSAFALHRKSELPHWMQRDLDSCRKSFGCYANYATNGDLKLGCNK